MELREHGILNFLISAGGSEDGLGERASYWRGVCGVVEFVCESELHSSTFWSMG
jgi:hypothetical protein